MNEYLEYKFWIGDNCYFRKLSLWEIIKYKLGLLKGLIIMVPEDFKYEQS